MMTAAETEKNLDELEAGMLMQAQRCLGTGYINEAAALARGLLDIALYRRVKAGGGVRMDADGGLGLPAGKGPDDDRH